MTVAKNRGSGRNERGLRQKSRPRTAMRLRGVDEEWMTKINRSAAPAASSLNDRPFEPAGARILAMSRCEPARTRVGASFTPTSEKRNNISRARPFEFMLTRQFHKVALAAMFRREAGIDMPSRFAGLLIRRKPNGKRAEIRSRKPSLRADELIEMPNAVRACWWRAQTAPGNTCQVSRPAWSRTPDHAPCSRNPPRESCAPGRPVLAGKPIPAVRIQR
jgi:hypothetical protein